MSKADRTWLRLAIAFLVCTGAGGASALWASALVGRIGTYIVYALMAVAGVVLYTVAKER